MDKKKLKLDFSLIFPFFIIFFVITLFFQKLFFPGLKMFVCPDFGSGDVWYYNYPVKSFAANLLRQGKLPLWVKDLGGGFPLFAEGQTGLFFLPNLLFLLLDIPLAFNLQYVLSFLIAALGLFFYLRNFRFSVMISLFAGLTLSFSGYFVTQISHLNLLQSASLIPWILLLTEKLWTNKNLKTALILSLLLSQQFFAGYIQISFITVFIIMIYHGINIIELRQSQEKKQCLKTAIYPTLLLTITLVLTGALSAIQILPSTELLNLSVRKGGFSSTYATSFSFPFRHFLTFLNPFFLGNPKEGTYPGYSDGTFFWENTAYIGIIPLILVLFSLFNLQRKKIVKIFFVILLISGLLMLGKFSPLYLIYSLPPFNFFRVPSRFLLAFLVSGVILAAIGLEQSAILLTKRLKKKKLAEIIIYCLSIFSIYHLFSVWHTYHLAEPSTQWLKAPETAQFLSLQAKPGKIISTNEYNLCANYYLENGWRDKNDYLYFRNTLLPNISLLWNLSHFDIYVGNIQTKRFIYYNSLAAQEIKLDENKSLLNDQLKLLSLANVRYVISSVNIINSESLELIFETHENRENLPSFKIYENKNVLPRARMVYGHRKVETVEEMQRTLLSKDFDPAREAILEKGITRTREHENTRTKNQVEWVKDEDQEIEIEVETKSDGFLVLADSYYPGWKAFVNGKETEILAANLNQRAIQIEQGSHQVKFIYQPESFKTGAIISGITFIIIIIIIVFQLGFPFLSSFLDRVARIL